MEPEDTHFYLVDSRQSVFLADGTQLKLRPQSYQVFEFLVDHAHTIVSKEQLLRSVWGSVSVTEDSVTQCIADIRRVLGSDHRHLLQTVPKKGYYLSLKNNPSAKPVVQKTNVLASRTEPPSSSSGSVPIVQSAHSPVENDNKSDTIGFSLRRRDAVLAAAALLVFTIVLAPLLANVFNNEFTGQNNGHGTGPSIAVLPFSLNAPDESTNYFSEGISSDITIALSRFADLRVLSAHTATVAQANDDLLMTTLVDFDPQYTLSGSVRKTENRIKLNVELTDFKDGRLLWSQQYNEIIEDVFVLQETVARKVATHLSVSLTEIETAKIYNKPTDNMEAYDYLLLAQSKLRRRNRFDNYEARELLRKVVELDDKYTQAYIDLGYTYLEEAMLGYSEWPDAALTEATNLAQKAVQLDSNHPKAIGFLARVYFRQDKFDLSMAELERALELNPNDPELYVLKGLVQSRQGNISEAIDNLEYARLFDPEVQSGWSELGGLYFLNRQLDEAILTLERGLAQIPHLTFVHVWLVAAYVESGKMVEARQAAGRLRRWSPFFDIISFSKYSLFYSESQKQRVIEAFSKIEI